MKKKKIITITLLLFVIGSLVTIFVKENKSLPKETITENKQTDKTIVYYFHGNARCVTCKTIEAFTIEAVEGNYRNKVEDGSIEIIAVNVEKAQNQHFISDYELQTRSVVISSVKDGIEVNWRRLDKVWTLVRDKEKFFTYIKDEMTPIINGEI